METEKSQDLQQAEALGELDGVYTVPVWKSEKQKG